MDLDTIIPVVNDEMHQGSGSTNGREWPFSSTRIRNTDTV